MAKDLERGDKVEWNTPQGKTRGRVVKKLTRATHVKGHKVAASAENPECAPPSSPAALRRSASPRW